MTSKVVTAILALSAMFACPASVRFCAAQGRSASNLSAPERTQFVDFHNDVRREVGVGPVTWSETLAQSAQNWANRVATTGRIEHSQFGEGKPGENLAWGAGRDYKPIDGAKYWYAEKKFFRPGTKVDSQNFRTWGHYSQMVWSKTTEIGVGVARISAGRSAGNLIVVCHYNPGGNMMGETPYGGPETHMDRGGSPPVTAPTAPGSAAQSGFPKGYFYMTTRFVEREGLVLESAPLTLRPRTDVTGMLWKAIPADDTYFYLTSQYLEGQRQVLEGHDGQYAAEMTPATGATGSLWRAIPVGDGYYYLTSKYMEREGKVLEGSVGEAKAPAGDPFRGTPHMVSGRPTGTHWKFIPVK